MSTLNIISTVLALSVAIGLAEILVRYGEKRDRARQEKSQATWEDEAGW